MSSSKDLSLEPYLDRCPYCDQTICEYFIDRPCTATGKHISDTYEEPPSGCDHCVCYYDDDLPCCDCGEQP